LFPLDVEAAPPSIPIAISSAFIMSQFRAKTLDIGSYVNKLVIRDHTKRKVFREYETERFVLTTLACKLHVTNSTDPRRQALRYTIRNTSFPPRMRAQAQLLLSQMHCYTRPTQIKNRCIMGGKGRGVLSDFRMARVSIFTNGECLLRETNSFTQFQFRMNAMAGNIPGVKKASW
jgi:small subunit ribosomal protein S14